MAALMACAHAKFTGDVGVCLATSGPGAIHLLNDLYDAKLDHRSAAGVGGHAHAGSRCASGRSRSRTGPSATADTASTAASARSTATHTSSSGWRMGTRREDSVIDADHRVWGAPNLFVCDGSVMPTQGAANPASTIMALASRLAERLAAKRLDPARAVAAA